MDQVELKNDQLLCDDAGPFKVINGKCIRIDDASDEALEGLRLDDVADGTERSGGCAGESCCCV